MCQSQATLGASADGAPAVECAAHNRPDQTAWARVRKSWYTNERGHREQLAVLEALTRTSRLIPRGSPNADEELDAELREQRQGRKGLSPPHGALIQLFFLDRTSSPSLRARRITSALVIVILVGSRVLANERWLPRDGHSVRLDLGRGPRRDRTLSGPARPAVLRRMIGPQKRPARRHRPRRGRTRAASRRGEAARRARRTGGACPNGSRLRAAGFTLAVRHPGRVDRQCAAASPRSERGGRPRCRRWCGCRRQA